MSWCKQNKGNVVRPVSEINMVPLIDVMLVLLVIFMITAPLLTHSIPVNLPHMKSSASQADKAQISKPLVISIRADGSLYLGDSSQSVERKVLQQQLRQQASADALRIIQIRADEDVPYRFVAKTLEDVSEAGLSKIALVGRQ